MILYILYYPCFSTVTPVLTLKCYCFMIITFIDKCDHLKKVHLSSGAIFTQLKIIKLYVQFKSEIGREIGSLTPIFLTAIYRKLHHFRKVHPLEFYFTWAKEAFYAKRILLLDGCYVHLFLSLKILAAGLFQKAWEINAVMKERTVTALGFYLSRGKLQLHQTSILQYKSLFIAILSLTENSLL